MGCCNEKRARWSKFAGPAPSTASASTGTIGAMTREVPLTRTVVFEYTGETAMSVLGPITRTRYRFRSTGDRVGIDYRDASYVSGVPNVRRVR